jgi:hypothetical protein
VRLLWFRRRTDRGLDGSRERSIGIQVVATNDDIQPRPTPGDRRGFVEFSPSNDRP